MATTLHTPPDQHSHATQHTSRHNVKRDSQSPWLGYGLGLRPDHYPAILAGNLPSQIDWFEIISENYMALGGQPRQILREIAAQYPVVAHGVSLSIGGMSKLDSRYLDALGQLADEINAPWVSDHLCFTEVDGVHLHDLLPMPFTEAALEHIARRVETVQKHIGRPLLLENVSSYLQYRDDEMPEWEFLTRLTEAADCGLLLDVNNVYVNAHNHHFDPETFIDSVPSERIWQIHLAGHSQQGNLKIDTHDDSVPEPVWSLFSHTLQKHGRISTMIERDDHIPPLEDLLTELDHAREIGAAVLGQSANG